MSQQLWFCGLRLAAGQATKLSVTACEAVGFTGAKGTWHNSQLVQVRSVGAQGSCEPCVKRPCIGDPGIWGVTITMASHDQRTCCLEMFESPQLQHVHGELRRLFLKESSLKSTATLYKFKQRIKMGFTFWQESRYLQVTLEGLTESTAFGAALPLL